LRILFLKPTLGTGGGTRWVFRVCHDLARRGYEPSLMFFQSNIAREVYWDLMRSLKIIKADSIKLLIGNPIPVNIFRLIRTFNQYDLLYVHFTPPNDFLMSLIKAGLKVSTVIGFHSFFKIKNPLHFMYLNAVTIPVIKSFSCIHVLNKSLASFLRELGSRNIYLIPNGVDTRNFQLCRNPSNSKFFNMLFTGRLTEDKGVDILMEIIQYVNEKLKLQNIKFTIAGSGPFEDKVRAVAQKYKNVDYLGFVNPEVISKVYMNAKTCS